MALPEVGVQAVVKDFNKYIGDLSKMDKANQALGGSIDDFSKTAEQSSKSLGDMSTATKDASKAIETTGDSAVETAAKIEIMEKGFEAIRDLASQGLELAELGAQAERVEQRFAAFAEAAGGAEQILQAFQDGAGGTVSEMEAMQSATKLLQMGLVSNADEMANVVELATRLGDQTESASARVEGFALLLANQSIPRLDNYGISSGKVRARIAELQEQTEGLSREQAFMQATMEEGGKSLLVLGDRVDDNAAKFEKAQARMEDARVEMGKKLAPIFATVASLVSGLSSDLIAFVGILGSGIGILKKFGGSLDTVAGKLGTSTARLGLLAAEIGILIEVTNRYKQTLNEIDAATEQAAAASSAWGGEIDQMIAEGMTLEESLSVLAQRTNEATDAFNESGLAGTGLGDMYNVTGRLAYALTGGILDVNRAAREGTSSYEEYVAALVRYNAQLTDDAGKVGIMSEASYNLRQEIDAGKAGWDNLSEAERANKEAILDQIIATQGMTGAEINAKIAAEEQTEAIGGLIIAHDDLAYAVSIVNATIDDSVYATAEAKLAQREGAEAAEEYGRAHDEAKDKVSGAAGVIVGAVQDYKQAELDAAEAAEEAEQAAKDLAAAQEEARLSAANSAIAFNDLAQALMDATAADIARASMEKLDAALEAGKISGEQHARATRELMLEYGLATEESLALAEGIDILGEAVLDGTLHSDDYTEAVGNMITASEDGTVSQEELLGEFERTPAVFGDAEDAMGRVEDMIGDALPASAQESEDAIADLEEQERQLAEQTAITEEAIGRAETKLSDDLPAAADTSVGKLDSLKEAAGRAGDAIGDTLAGRIRDKIPSVVGAVAAMADAAMAQLPASEPKDPSSPFRGLGERGEAVIGNFVGGIIDATPGAVDAFAAVGSEMGIALVGSLSDELEAGLETAGELLDLGRAVGGIGGGFARIFKKRTIDPLKDELKGMDDEMERLAEARQEAMERGDLATGMRLAQEMAALEGERAARAEELAAQQERLVELQERQLDLQFLQQQFELMQLIQEAGLDPADILGGLELGLGADVGALMDAMSAALQAIIGAAEDELQIGSPSKVFANIGAEMMQGLAAGIAGSAGMPAAQTLAATQTAMMAPSFAMPTMAGGSTTNIDAPISISATINNGMDETRFYERVTRVVSASIRGNR